MIVLNSHDKASQLWLNLKKHYEERLHNLRCKNDNGTLNEQRTAAIRGEIAMIKEFLGLDKDPI